MRSSSHSSNPAPPYADASSSVAASTSLAVPASSYSCSSAPPLPPPNPAALAGSAGASSRPLGLNFGGAPSKSSASSPLRRQTPFPRCI